MDNPNLNQDRVPARLQRYLPAEEALASSDGLPNTRRVVKLVSGFLILAFVWALFTQINEISRAPGKVIPQGQVQVVQHMEGGTVLSLNVKDGDPVIAGKTMLLELDPSMVESELKKNQSRELALLIDAERLRAFISGDQKNFDRKVQAIIQKTGVNESTARLEQMGKDERLLLTTQQQAREDRRAVLAAQIEQLNADRTRWEKQEKTAQRNLELVQKEKAMYDEVDLISKRDRLEINRRVNNAQSELDRAITSKTRNQKDLFEAQKRVQGLDSQLQKSAAEDLGAINTELVQLQETIKRLKTRMTRLRVIAPVSGVISGVNILPGSVIHSGQALLQIVPSNRKLVVEANIGQQDIGHVRVGDPVKVKVASYEFSRYGTIPGVLTAVSPFTHPDGQGHSYYRAVVSLAQNYVGDDPRHHAVRPGMRVDAMINTGHKSLLGYLLRPINRSMSQAFNER